MIDGTSGTVGDITNTLGVLHVVKEGAEAWTLDGRLDFNGELTVAAGTLTLAGDSTLPNLGGLSVAAGASLKVEGAITPVRRLTVDALTGMGTIDGTLALADVGTLNLVDMPETFDRVVVPVASWRAFPSRDQLLKWVVTADGKPLKRQYLMSFTSGGLVLARSGCALVFR